VDAFDKITYKTMEKTFILPYKFVFFSTATSDYPPSLMILSGPAKVGGAATV
jgi:hypothetical protein